MAYRSLFIMDPITSINIDGDSTFVLMLESQRRGHEIWYAESTALSLVHKEPWVRAQRVELRRKKGEHYTPHESKRWPMHEMQAIYMRKDPPFDIEYVLNTLILSQVDQNRVVMINNPQAIRDCNEKMYALDFPEFVPPTLISSSETEIRAFLEAQGEIIIKPLIFAGGAGIVLMREHDPNLGSVVQLLTHDGRRPVEAQRYLSAVREGDKRILLLNGEPIGAINRRPKTGDIRSNMHAGGTPEATELTTRELEICAALRPQLQARGLVFVGIDVIGGYLTEINVTSPTGLQELNRFNNISSEALIIDWVENQIRARNIH